MRKLMTTSLFAFWCSGIALCGGYFAPLVLNDGMKPSSTKGAVKKSEWETKNTEVINIPVIKKEKLLGYLVVKFAYVVATSSDDTAAIDVKYYILDEALRVLYADSNKNGREMQQYDLKTLSNHILTRVNTRHGRKSIKRIFVRKFNFVAARDVF